MFGSSARALVSIPGKSKLPLTYILVEVSRRRKNDVVDVLPLSFSLGGFGRFISAAFSASSARHVWFSAG